METEQLKQEIKELLLQANPEIHIVDDDTDLFSASCHVAPRDLLFVCMELKRVYAIDYNQVVDQVKVYSLNQFAEAVGAQI